MQPFQMSKAFAEFCDPDARKDKCAQLVFLDHCQDAGLPADYADLLRRLVERMWEMMGTGPHSTGPHLFESLLASLTIGDPGVEWREPKKVNWYDLWHHICTRSRSTRHDLLLTLDDSGWLTDECFLVSAPAGLADRFAGYALRPRARLGRVLGPVDQILVRQGSFERSDEPAVVVGYRTWEWLKKKNEDVHAMLFDPATGMHRLVDAELLAYCRLLQPKATFHLRTVTEDDDAAVSMRAGLGAGRENCVGYLMPLPY